MEIHSSYAGIICLLTKDTLLTATAPFSTAPSAVDFWDIKTGKIRARMVAPTPISYANSAVSPDGRYLIALQTVAAYLPHPIFNPHILYLWRLSDRRLLRRIDLGRRTEVYGISLLPGRAFYIAVTEYLLDNPARSPNVLILDALTGQKVTVYRTQKAVGLGPFSPSGRLMACCYPPGEGNMNGSFDLYNAGNFQHLLNNTGSETHPIDGPAFFISNHQVVLGPTLYDTRTRRNVPTIRPRRAATWTCLAPIPMRPGYALFLVEAETGGPRLQLWNVLSDRCVHCWHTLVPVIGQRYVYGSPAYISRDGKAFALVSDNSVVRVYDDNFNALPPARSPSATPHRVQ